MALRSCEEERLPVVHRYQERGRQESHRMGRKRAPDRGPTAARPPSHTGRCREGDSSDLAQAPK